MYVCMYVLLLLLLLTPSPFQPVQYPGLMNGCTDVPANIVFSAPVASTFNTVCFDEYPFTCQCEKKAETVKGDDEVLLNVLRCQLTY